MKFYAVASKDFVCGLKNVEFFLYDEESTLRVSLGKLTMGLAVWPQFYPVLVDGILVEELT